MRRKAEHQARRRCPKNAGCAKCDLARTRGNARQMRRYRKRRAMALEYLGGKCEVCGLDDPDYLEFDHVDPRTKPRGGHDNRLLDFGDIWWMPEEQFWDHVELMQLLCNEDHKRKTRADRGLPPLEPAPF